MEQPIVSDRTNSANTFLSGGGEMGRLVREFDWSKTPLGSVNEWSQSLCTTLGIVLHFAFPMFLFWGKELICFYNDAFRPSLGIEGKHPAIGKTGQEVWSEIWEFIGPLIEKVMRTGEPVWFEDQLVPFYRNGKMEDIYWTFSYSPAYGDDGLVNGVFVTCTETTEKIKIVKNLADSNQRFQNFISQATVGIIVLMDEDCVVDVVNNAYARLINRTTRELVGKKLFDVIPEIEKYFRSVIDNVRQTGEPLYFYEHPYFVNVDGNKKESYLDLVYKPFRNGSDVITGVMILCQDVTEQVNARKKIKESEERFAAAVDAVQGIVWTNNEHGEMEGEQLGWATLTGQRYEEYKGYGWANAVHPDDAQATINAWNEAVSKRATFIFEHRLHTKNGTWRHFSIRAIPLINSDGSIREWVGVHTDITEHRLAEEVLKESEQRFRSLADNSPMIVYIVEPDAVATMSYFNSTWLNYTGQTFEQAIGRAWDGIVHPEDLYDVFTIYVPAFEKRVSYTLPAVRLKRHDGEYRWHLFKGNPRYLPNGQFIGFVGVGIDIHDQKVIEQVLKESEERFRNLADHAPMLIWMVDENAVITYANKELLNFIGVANYSEVATQGGWERVTHPDDMLNVYQAFMEGLTNRAEYKVEARLKYAALGVYEWFFFKAAPRFLANGQFAGFIGTAVNIQQQKSLLSELEDRVQERTKELNIVNQALLQSNEDLQQFAHVASHDLKEPVRKIQTFINRLNDESDGNLSVKAQGYLEKIQKSTERMGAMIDGVLTYSSLNATGQKIELVDLNLIIESIESDLEILIQKKSATITKTQLTAIEGSAVLIYQLFYNLINNSLKFAKTNVAPLITITSRSFKTNGVELVSIELIDNGIGFKQEYSSKIFESFARLNPKDQFEGTGLGLSLCKKIVQRHNGTMEAKSNLNEGASFLIVLPVKQAVQKI